MCELYHYTFIATNKLNLIINSLQQLTVNPNGLTHLVFNTPNVLNTNSYSDLLDKL